VFGEPNSSGRTHRLTSRDYVDMLPFINARNVTVSDRNLRTVPRLCFSGYEPKMISNFKNLQDAGGPRKPL
jgi:hypothetical protein